MLAQSMQYPSVTETGETVYEDPDHHKLEDIYEDPERIDIYRTMSSVSGIQRGQGTLLEANVTQQTINKCFESYITAILILLQGHFDWSIYVPTQVYSYCI